MPRCLVVGGKGFIGSHLAAALVRAGWVVRVLDRPENDFLIPIPTGMIEVLGGDFNDAETIFEALHGCEYCIHLASTTIPKSSNDDPVYDVSSNLIGTIRLLEAAKACGVKKVVFTSSGGTVYGAPQYTPLDEDHPTNPSCSYGITKLAIEKYLSLFNFLHQIDYTVLRLSNPFGEGQRTHALQGAVAVFLGKCLRGEVVEIWGDGSVLRDYVYVGDIVEALILSMGPYRGSRVFNIGSGQPMSLLEVLDAIEAVTGRHIARRFRPARAFDVPVNFLSIVRAREMLGWQPRTGFIEGLVRTAAWLGGEPYL